MNLPGLSPEPPPFKGARGPFRPGGESPLQAGRGPGLLLRRRFLLAAAAGLLGWSGRAAAQGDATDLRQLARRRALEAARRLDADGWKVRDGLWNQRLTPGEPRLVPVHLIAANSYLFVAALRPVQPGLAFSLLDSGGRLLAEKSRASDAGLAALLFEPAASGRHYLMLETPAGAEVSEASTAYLYR